MSSRSQRFDAQVLNPDNVYAFKVLEGSLSTLVLTNYKKWSNRMLSVLSPYPLALLYPVNVVPNSDRGEGTLQIPLPTPKDSAVVRFPAMGLRPCAWNR